MTSVRVAEILAAVRADSPDGAGMPGGLVSACARSLPVSGVGLALMTSKGPAGTVAATDGAALSRSSPRRRSDSGSPSCTRSPCGSVGR